MAIANLNTLCRLCLDPSEMLYKLDSDFCILVMESGASVTIADAMEYLAMDIKIAPEEKEENEDLDGEDQKSEDEENREPDPDKDDDDSLLPKSLCQDCLEKLQSAYEFKYRVQENKTFLRNYLKDCADTKAAEERAAKSAALAALDLDIDNLNDLPDKLVLKDLKKEKKPRKPRDPSKPPIARRRRVTEKNVIIAEDSQVDSAAYVRLLTTPEQSPEQKRTSQGTSKRKSKHVVLQDILVADKSGKKDPKKQKDSKASDLNTSGGAAAEKPLPTKIKQTKAPRDDDEPVFEDDDDFEEEPLTKKPKKSKN